MAKQEKQTVDREIYNSLFDKYIIVVQENRELRERLASLRYLANAMRGVCDVYVVKEAPNE